MASWPPGSTGGCHYRAGPWSGGRLRKEVQVIGQSLPGHHGCSRLMGHAKMSRGLSCEVDADSSQGGDILRQW